VRPDGQYRLPPPRSAYHHGLGVQLTHSLAFPMHSTI
jgi:hypothetical protein